MQQTEKITERTTMQENGSAKGVQSQQYLHTEKAGAYVPLLQAMITGLMIGLPVWGVGVWMRWRDAWIYGMITWFLVQALTWLLLSAHWTILSLAALEIIFNKDFNGDGSIGKKKARQAMPPVQVNLRTVQPNGHLSNISMLRFPGDPEALVMLATGLLGGASTAERVWSGEGKLFSQEDYRAIRRILIDNKLIELRNEKDARQGYVLTTTGAQVMQEIRDTYSGQTPPPPSEDF